MVRTRLVKTFAVSGFMKGEEWFCRADLIASVPSSCGIEVYSDDTSIVTKSSSSCKMAFSFNTSTHEVLGVSYVAWYVFEKWLEYFVQAFRYAVSW